MAGLAMSTFYLFLNPFDNGPGMLMGQVELDSEALEGLCLGLIDMAVLGQGLVNLGLKDGALAGHLVGK